MIGLVFYDHHTYRRGIIPIGWSAVHLVKRISESYGVGGRGAMDNPKAFLQLLIENQDQIYHYRGSQRRLHVELYPKRPKWLDSR